MNTAPTPDELRHARAIAAHAKRAAHGGCGPEEIAQRAAFHARPESLPARVSYAVRLALAVLTGRRVAAVRATVRHYVAGPRGRELAAVQRDYPPATMGPDVAARARTSEEAARHDGRAHLDAGDAGIKAIVSGCPACVTRPGGAR